MTERGSHFDSVPPRWHTRAAVAAHRRSWRTSARQAVPGLREIATKRCDFYWVCPGAPVASRLRRAYSACRGSVCTRQHLPARAHSAAIAGNGLRTTTRWRSSAPSAPTATPVTHAACGRSPLPSSRKSKASASASPGTSGAISGFAPEASPSSDGVASGAMPTYVRPACTATSRRRSPRARRRARPPPLRRARAGAGDAAPRRRRRRRRGHPTAALVVHRWCPRGASLSRRAVGGLEPPRLKRGEPTARQGAARARQGAPGPARAHLPRTVGAPLRACVCLPRALAKDDRAGASKYGARAHRCAARAHLRRGRAYVAARARLRLAGQGAPRLRRAHARAGKAKRCIFYSVCPALRAPQATARRLRRTPRPARARRRPGIQGGGALPQQRAHVRDLEAVERLGDVRQRAAVVRNKRREAHAAAEEVQREAVRLEEARACRRREDRRARPARSARDLSRVRALHRQECVEGRCRRLWRAQGSLRRRLRRPRRRVRSAQRGGARCCVGPGGHRAGDTPEGLVTPTLKRGAQQGHQGQPVRREGQSVHRQCAPVHGQGHENHITREHRITVARAKADKAIVLLLTLAKQTMAAARRVPTIPARGACITGRPAASTAISCAV